MAVFDWPEALIPQRCAIGSQSAGEDFKSPYNGTLQQVDYVAERFTLNATLPQRRRAAAGAVEAFLFRLRGGGNRVRAWHFSRPVPAGTLRGAPVLKTTVTRGASSLVLDACTGVNMLRNPGFEGNGGLSGYATGWGPYETGSTGTVTRDQATEAGGLVQRVFATALAPTGRAGVYNLTDMAVVPGQVLTVSLDAATGSGDVELWCEMNFLDAGLGFVGAASFARALTGSYARYSGQLTVPAGAVYGRLYFWMQSIAATGGRSLFIDKAQVSAQGITTFTSTTLKAGDMLGLGSQLFMAAEDATATDAGEMTVPVVHRVRSTLTAGSAVTWDKPTAEFTMPSRFASVVHFPGGIEGAGLDLEEYWAP